VRLAEIHFQKDRSVLAAPLIVASALAACTQRVKIGIAVQVLPLSHPLRLAEAREVRANRLAEISYDEVLGEYAVFGTPEAVADRLLALREEMGFSTLSTWMNPGGQIPNERVLRSMRRFAERAAPR